MKVDELNITNKFKTHQIKNVDIKFKSLDEFYSFVEHPGVKLSERDHGQVKVVCVDRATYPDLNIDFSIEETQN